MRGDLRRRSSVNSLFAEMIFDLLSARAGSLKILPCVPTNFRLPIPSALQFITEAFQTQRQFRAVYRRYISLRNEDFIWLQSARLAVVALRDVEDDSMSM